MTKLNTINCEEIMTEPLKPIEFMVDNLITQGDGKPSERVTVTSQHERGRVLRFVQSLTAE